MVFPKWGKYVLIFVFIAIVIAGLQAFRLWRYVYSENIKTEKIIYIPENASFKQVTDTLKKYDILKNPKAFQWVAQRKNYITLVKPGRYFLKKGMNTNQIVNSLRAGLQYPVGVTFNNLRTREDLAGKISRYLQTDSLSIINLFYNEALIQRFGFTPQTFKAMFIPNTYEFYWTTNALGFAERMKSEYDRFWNKQRLEKAHFAGLNQVEVIILASIVQAETAKTDELSRVAGLYINRLKRGQLLQADPTVKYALGNFGLKRILNVHLEVESPYNTYKYAGLPPGPINFPEISTIDAVLNYEHHDYLYMCAKEDFSGYHNFAKTLNQHNLNALKYQKALNENGIR
jgi:UPF0755 protein